MQEDVVSRRRTELRRQVPNDDDVIVVVISEVSTSRPSRRVWPAVAVGTPARVRQEAAQRVHALHEGEATASHRGMHAQRVGSHQPDSRQKGLFTSVYCYFA